MLDTIEIVILKHDYKLLVETLSNKFLRGVKLNGFRECEGSLLKVVEDSVDNTDVVTHLRLHL
jgi:hypothetical protein